MTPRRRRSERVFGASHVFRPTASLILANSILVLMVVSVPRRPSGAQYNPRGGVGGNVIVAVDPRRLLWLTRCEPVYTDPAAPFLGFTCPTVAPTPQP